MDRPVDFDVPATFRNWNFARLSWLYLACSVIALWVNDRSSYGLGWFGVAVQIGFVSATLFYAASWRQASLRVAHDILVVGGVFKTRRSTHSTRSTTGGWNSMPGACNARQAPGGVTGNGASWGCGEFG